MWRLAKSRAAFERPRPPGGSFLGEEPAVGALLDPRQHGSHTLLDVVMRSFPEGLGTPKSSFEIYCGLTVDGPLAESQSVAGGAWIAVDLRFVRLAAATTAVARVFPCFLSDIEAAGEHGQNMLDNARGSVFRYIGSECYPGALQYSDDSDIWDRGRLTLEYRGTADGSIAFVIGHELAHLLQGDGSSRPNTSLRNARAEACRQLVGPSWPTIISHQDELIADYVAINSLSNINLASASLADRMEGTFIAHCALAIDGWFMDGSSTSETHPSPFLRSWCLVGFWIDVLKRQRDAGLQEGGQPTSVELMRVAKSFVMVDWIAGRFREGREGGDAIWPDLGFAHRLLCEAAGCDPHVIMRIDIPFNT